MFAVREDCSFYKRSENATSASRRIADVSFPPQLDGSDNSFPRLVCIPTLKSVIDQAISLKQLGVHVRFLVGIATPEL